MDDFNKERAGENNPCLRNTLPLQHTTLSPVLQQENRPFPFQPPKSQWNYIAEFIEAMRRAGVPFTGEIIADGKIHRFKPEGERTPKVWYVFFGRAGAFGYWGKEIHEKWSTTNPSLTPLQREQINREREKASQLYREEIQRENQEASESAVKEWDGFSEMGHSDYLERKKVEAFGIRFGKGFLVIPLRDVHGKMWSHQKISDAGDKRFLKGGRKKGCFHMIGHLKDGQPAYITEGYATGASVYMATGTPVIIAFDAGNIESVVAALKEKYPKSQLTIAGDDDWFNTPNVGRKTAEEVGRKYHCPVVFPEFKEEHHHERPTDFNDLHCIEGVDKVTEQLLNFTEFSKTTPAYNIEAEIARLASLPPIEYEQQRKKAAEALGFRTFFLDEEVEKLKPLSEKSSQESLETFPAVEPWAAPVGAEDFLNEIINTLKRFVILPEYAAEAIALWIVFTYFIEEVHIAPILAISSPEKQCGKTTVLSILTELVAKPLAASNITSSCVFRSIEWWSPTLIIDEADTFISNSEELRGVLNSGHTKPTAYVVRSVGDTYTPTRFTTWGAKTIALIGKLPDTLHDRSIVIPLKRKLLHEKTEKLRHSDDNIFINLRRKLVRFYEDHQEIIKTIRPNLPENISDRAADNWEPLLMVAHLAGTQWIKKATEAAVGLSGRAQEATSKGVELLKDIKQIFENKELLEVKTVDLITFLCEDDEMPWLTWNRGKPIAPRQISKILSLYNINSNTIRFSDRSTLKGFKKSQFEEAWKRYLSAKEENVTDTSVTDNLSVTKNHRETALCNAVTAVTANSGIYFSTPPKLSPEAESISHLDLEDFSNVKFLAEEGEEGGGYEGEVEE